MFARSLSCSFQDLQQSRLDGYLPGCHRHYWWLRWHWYNHDVDFVDDDNICNDNQSNLHQREGRWSRPNSRKSSVNEQPHRSLQGLGASVLLIISLCSLLCYHHHHSQSINPNVEFEHINTHVIVHTLGKICINLNPHHADHGHHAHSPGSTEASHK